MNFDSFAYIIFFLPIVFAACQLARLSRIAKGPQICVLVASLFFYIWAKPSYLPYLLASVIVNWLIARWIGSSTGNRRLRVLQLGLIVNIGYLSSFKYLNFFISNIPYLVERHVRAPDLPFPLGISFFTVTQIMFLVDCYEELIPPSSFFDHLTFVSFFPYIISGPLSRAKRILQQFPALNGPTGPTADKVARSIYLFSLGLIKKVVLADAFSKAADYGFSNVPGLSIIEAWCFAIAYGLQIYFDFSGYSDMAVASAELFGIEIPRNFDAPFRATSITEFWQRWHISLTAFITTYIYTPLVRSMGSVTLFTSAIATFLAMAIAGLWHGPNWTYVAYGAVHGVGLSINQSWRRKKMPHLPKPLAWFMTYLVYQTGFVMFRAPNMHTAMLYMRHMVDFRLPLGLTTFPNVNGQGQTAEILIVAQIAGVLVAVLGKSTNQLARDFQPQWHTWAAASACTLFSLLYMNSNVAKPFIYFGF